MNSIIIETFKVFLGAGIVLASIECFIAFRKHRKRPTAFNALSAAHFFCVALFLLAVYVGVNRGRIGSGLFGYFYLPALLFTGPTLLMLNVAAVRPLYRVQGWAKAHFLPGLLVLVALPILGIAGYQGFERYPLDYFDKGGVSLLDVVTMLTIVHNAVYLGLLIGKARSIFRIHAAKAVLMGRGFVAGASIIVAIAVLITLAFVLRNADLLVAGTAAISALYIWINISARLYPHFFADLGFAIETGMERGAYKNSQLKDLDLKAIDIQLREIFEKGRVYAQEDLTAKELAAMLDLKPYQLSEYLSMHRETNFNTLINGYRIREAAKLISDSEGQVSILSTAYHVGFNSKATFNAAFKKHLGCSPSEYRRWGTSNN